MSSDSTFPEDYVETDYSKEEIMIKEVHRSNERIVLETEDFYQASLATSVLALRLFCPMKRDDLVEQLKNLVKQNSFEDVYKLLENQFPSDCYSIGRESYDKVSLIITGNNADVKYHSEYLAQSAGLPRAYAVLYNYCKKKIFIEEWCSKHISTETSIRDVKELEGLYMLGIIS